MIIFEYKEKRTNNLFSTHYELERVDMYDDQVIIYYPRKLIDVPYLKIACILQNSCMIKFFKDKFLEELEKYLSTMRMDIAKSIHCTKDEICFYNSSSIKFLSQYVGDNRLRGLDINILITNDQVNIDDYIHSLKPRQEKK